MVNLVHHSIGPTVIITGVERMSIYVFSMTALNSLILFLFTFLVVLGLLSLLRTTDMVNFSVESITSQSQDEHLLYKVLMPLPMWWLRWSEMLSPGPANLCMECSKAMKHDLWQNQLWLKRKAAAERGADSDEDDTEQFGIQEGAAEGTAEGADDAGAVDEDQGDVYPLYGQDDSDFGDSNSDVSGIALLLLQCSLLCMVSMLCSPACAHLANVQTLHLACFFFKQEHGNCWHAHLHKREWNAKDIAWSCMHVPNASDNGDNIARMHNRADMT